VEARKEKKAAEEEAKRREKEEKEAQAAADRAVEPVQPEAEAVVPAEDAPDARMTKEQLSELAEALSILTAKSSIVKERDELKSLLEENLLSEAVRNIFKRWISLTSRNPSSVRKSPTRHPSLSPSGYGR
jgi:LETM1 and EF-hand domain-containing protein 1